MTTARVLVCAAAIAALGPPLVARASEASEARAAYQEGEADYALGHYDKALARFEEAYKLSRKTALLFNIAQCHRQMKNFEMAATTYRSFIRLDPQSKQVAQADLLLKQVEAAVKSQQSASSAPPLELSDSKAADAEAPPPPMAATEPAPPTVIAAIAPADESPAPQRSRTLTWVAAGGSALALGAGAMFGLQSKSTASQITSGDHDRTTVDSLRSQQSSQASKANLLFAAGAGLAAVTAALFVLRF